MADGVRKGVYPKIFGHSKQLSLNKFFDPSTPFLLVGDHPWWVTILGLNNDFKDNFKDIFKDNHMH